jgi:hypothetical protein
MFNKKVDGFILGLKLLTLSLPGYVDIQSESLFQGNI